MCSTPFGIRDIFTHTVFTMPFTESCVFNAFRHQRYLHRTTNCNLRRQIAMCSTPFGIRDIFTRRRSDHQCAITCAQRLSASEISSHWWCLESSTVSGFCAQRVPGELLIIQAAKHVALTRRDLKRYPGTPTHTTFTSTAIWRSVR